jgi:hypothetical protein
MQRCGAVLKDLHHEVWAQVLGVEEDSLSMGYGHIQMPVGGWRPNLDGPGMRRNPVIERIDRWGFSSLTGY